MRFWMVKVLVIEISQMTLLFAFIVRTSGIYSVLHVQQDYGCLLDDL